ncbi:mRNA splicing protein [Coemansia spiralis]|uniref:Pre-mRNA-splicing factor SLU7 n=2 Tax=Coemansia TaxID=4863 RepID=A0A9W8KZP6_9FUNG|nr:Pre-mRNA splicing Prp18-interacting factor-domain-containing protein [Coemansia spiralis]KAJ1995217.1 mRNA splicing protein [Coemansia umbellata]KAJ2625617.1 mRNA splicing protein [Coemansia sp. RSA 1358]KAJ2678747.1 mRNA splicing protein [Coemansia spiralis]
MSSAHGGNSSRLSREDYKKQKDLEAARKAGTAPAEVDEEGNEINPHIPQFMSKAPWYMDTGKAGLQHQRKKQKDAPTAISEAAWYARGARVGEASKKFRKGACENCGAMSHKTISCMERPRKKGARWTGKDMMADEVVQDIKLSYDAKHDRWNGYDPSEHRKLMEEWELMEEARKKRKASELDKGTSSPSLATGTSTAADGGKLDIEAQFASSDEENEDGDRPIGRSITGDEEKLSAKSKSTVRNLRIREDTAKYLRNLDPESAYYDPKTRSMRENPYAGKDAAQLAYAGDNFVRYAGEAQDVAKKEIFAWEANERGNNSAHFQANPTQTSLMYNEFKSKKETMRETQRLELLSKYGGEEHLQAPPRELLHQNERYVEYSRTGQVINGIEPPAAKTHFKEDVYPLNHTSVFGSWWSNSKWGYKCCHQTLRNAYCTASALSKG